ncbi:hypothetical protein HDV02_001951 [Globomyces sp. JEL0801]|nr:hypothetical protein HDV02_001951 [Globomyces sp. JEL0801]
MTENTELFIKYLETQPVKIETHFIGDQNRRRPLKDVGDVLRAYFPNAQPNELGLYSLHLPDGIDRSVLPEACYVSIEETGSALRPGLALNQLNGLGLDDRYPLIIKSSASYNQVPMDSNNLLNWICGSKTNSTTDLCDLEIFSQEDIQSHTPVLFPLAGREESMQQIKNCFLNSYKERHQNDRNLRPIPVCTGIPGIGKTRLIEECPSSILDMTQIPGQRVCGIISFGNDGNPYGEIDDIVGIQASFAWRVIHMFFKAHYKYQDWMCKKSPKNRKQMNLNLALEMIEQHWTKKTNSDILLFIGIDEYQQLGQENLDTLLHSICNCSQREKNSKLSFFCMLAGTDLNMTRIAKTAFPNTKRIPIRFLTHMESMAAVGPFISKFHGGFAGNAAFAHNVFFLGGVPRLLTEFAKAVSNLSADEMNENQLRDVRMSVLSKLQYPQLSYSDILRLLAISFTNTPVLKILDNPFPNSLRASKLTWSELISNGVCLLQDNGCVIVPFHLVVQVLDIETDGLGEYEQALVTSLKDMSKIVEESKNQIPKWLTWESFGAQFYSIRINSFLVLGKDKVSMSSLLRGSRFSDGGFEDIVCLKIAKVIYSTDQFGPNMPRFITPRGSLYPVDWIESDFIYIVLNGENGPGVDLFFILKRQDKPNSYILLLDQRKWISSDINNSMFSSIKSKIPDDPKCINGEVKRAIGIMSIYSQIKIDFIPECYFTVSSSESFSFHGSLFDHPGCALKIDVNTATVTGLCQIFGGTKRKSIAEMAIVYRKSRKFVDEDDLKAFVTNLNGELNASSLDRICY